MSSSSLNGGPQGAVVGAADDSTVRTLDDSLHSVKVQAFHLRKSLV
jgi:hypothetical protein